MSFPFMVMFLFILLLLFFALQHFVFGGLMTSSTNFGGITSTGNLAVGGIMMIRPSQNGGIEWSKYFGVIVQL